MSPGENLAMAVGLVCGAWIVALAPSMYSDIETATVVVTIGSGIYAFCRAGPKRRKGKEKRPGL